MWVLRRIVSSQARGVAAVEPGDAAVGAQQGVLHEIFGFGVVAGEGVGDPQQHLDLGQHVPPERGVVGRWLSHALGTLRDVSRIPRKRDGADCVLAGMSVRRRVDHLRLRRYLDAYVDGEIDDSRLAHDMADHVAHCPMCAATARTTTVVKHRLSLRRFLPSHTATRARQEDRRRPGQA